MQSAKMLVAQLSSDSPRRKLALELVWASSERNDSLPPPLAPSRASPGLEGGGGGGITWDYGINRCTRTIYKKKVNNKDFLKNNQFKNSHSDL